MESMFQQFTELLICVLVVILKITVPLRRYYKLRKCFVFGFSCFVLLTKILVNSKPKLQTRKCFFGKP